VAHRALLMQLGGLAVFLFGLKFLGVLHVPWLEREYRPFFAGKTGGGLVGGFVLGATFGLGWTPCIGPVLGSVLTYAASAAAGPASGALYLGAFALGLSLPLIAVAAVAPLALGWMKRMQRWMRPMQLATGALLALVGLLLVTDKVGLLSPASLVEHQAPAAAPAGACGGDGDSAQTACGLPESEQAGAQQAIPAGPAMVEFVSDSCPICLRMAPVVAAAERDCAGQAVKVVRIRVDQPGGRELARRHGVMGVPTFVFVDGGGAEAARLVGEQTLATLEQTIQVLSGTSCGGFRAFPPDSATGGQGSAGTAG
jgi:cytochrome c-type biogenesis protein